MTLSSVKEITRALEKVQAVAELLEFVDEGRCSAKTHVRREQPFLLREKALGREGLADRPDSFDAVRRWMAGVMAAENRTGEHPYTGGAIRRFGPGKQESSCPRTR